MDPHLNALGACDAAGPHARTGKDPGAQSARAADGVGASGCGIDDDQTRVETSVAQLREVVESVLHGLLVVDAVGRIELVNRQLESMFGYARAQLLGAPMETLMPERYRGAHAGLIAAFFAQPSRRDMAARRELFARRADGSEFPVEIGLNPIRTGASLRVLATITDVTERKAAQHQIEAALGEKTALLKEVHHRVKNNLQVVSSLLRMQARGAPPEVARVLAESGARMQAMAMLHQLLYERGDLTHIPLGEYLAKLVALLRATYSDQCGAIATRLEGTRVPCDLEMQRAISCGLIVNELITNAYKHAFPHGRSGTITVLLDAHDPRRVRILVADDGVGMPQEVRLGEGLSLGVRLLPTLVEQLEGELRLERGAGVRYELTFQR